MNNTNNIISEAVDILKNLGINPLEPVIEMDKAYALTELMDYIRDSDVSVIDLSKLDKETMTAILSEYANSIFQYHPESNHQERGAILGVWETLKTQFNLTDEDYDVIDFD